MAQSARHGRAVWRAVPAPRLADGLGRSVPPAVRLFDRAGAVRLRGAAAVAGAAGSALLEALRSSGRLADRALSERLARVRDDLFVAYFGGLGLVLLARSLRPLAERRFGSVRITYADGRSVRIPRGFSVLDASRIGSIPHASICGGRGRCSTCRIRVLRGVAALPEPTLSEQRLLSRLGAGPSVRLACQLRPVADVVVLPLLPPDITASDRKRHGGAAGGRERFVAILFVDMRRSTALLEKRPPFDALFILNHFFEAVGSAVARLETLTKEFGCQMIVSELVGITAGVDLSGFPGQELSIRGRDAGLAVLTIENAGLLGIRASAAK